MINIYYRSVKEAKAAVIGNFRHGSWIDVCDPAENEIEKIVELFGVDKSLLSDALDQFEVPRLEMENGITYVYTRVPEKRENEIITMPLLIAIGKDFILTLSKGKFNFLEDFINGKKTVYTTEKIQFFLKLFFAVNERYNFFLHDINKRLRTIKIRLERIDTEDIVQFVEFERTLNDFLSALVPTNSVLQKLLIGRHIELYSKDKDLIEDLFLGNGQLIEMSKSTLKNVINIRDTYSNIMTHNLNRTMRILTSLTILLTIPTMIFSFFGMNVNLPYSSHQFSYLAVVCFTLLISLILIILFIKNRWLR